MADAWALKILSGPHVGAEIALDPGTWVLGRHEECDLVLTDETLAERHLELNVSNDNVQVSNLAQGQNIYLSGDPQPDHFELTPHTVVMAGSLYFAVGQVGQPWPELSLSGPPVTPRAQPAPQTPEPSAAVSSEFEQELQAGDNIPVIDDRVEEDELDGLSQESPETEKTEGFFNRLQNVVNNYSSALNSFNPARWARKHPFILAGSGAGIFLTLIMGVFIWLWSLTDPEQKALDNITPAQQAEAIINQMKLQDLQLKKLPDNSVMISGYIADNTAKDKLQTALNDSKVPYTFQAVVMNDMRATAAKVLEQYEFTLMSIELDTTPGSLVLSGYAANVKEVSRIREVLKQEVHGLVTIVDQVEYQATRLKALRTMLKEKNVGQRIQLMETPGRIVLKGRLSDAAQGYHLKEIVQNFREKYQDRPKLVIDVVLPATDLATMQPLLKIKSISLGRIPYVILDNGEKYLRGAKLKNGYILENINLEYLTLKLGQERIKYFIGGSNGGQ